MNDRPETLSACRRGNGRCVWKHALLRGRRLSPRVDARSKPGRPRCSASPLRKPKRLRLPEALPQVAWRAGLDLNPLDVTDADQMAWLETLVWPEQEQRLARLRAAVEVAQAAPPRVMRGDLRQGLATLAAEAPPDLTLVIFHTAVLAYVPGQADREDFAASVTSLCDFWIANESVVSRGVV